MMNGSSRLAGLLMLPNTASTRPPMGCEFQSYVRVVITIRGASVVRRRMRGG